MTPLEVELKFQVPAGRRAAVEQALRAASAVPMRAAYYDTADERLAAAGLALRVRQEGPRWVQTLKGRGDGLMVRPEHELELPARRTRPAVDPARHAGTEVGDALLALLADGAPLVERYRTDIVRHRLTVRQGGARVEIAFDAGHIASGRRRVPVCELEFELLAGDAAGLFALAERWAVRHALWLDVRTKSERGTRLARGWLAVPACKAPALPAPREASPAGVFAAMLLGTLAHVLPNAAEIADGTDEAEHLHQLRVALRRLRTALRLFGTWSLDPAQAAAVEQAWRPPFSRLGAVRDTDVLASMPALAALVLPPPPAAEEPGAVVREPAFAQALLQTLALAHRPLPALQADLQPALQAVLRRSWRQVADGAARFATDGPPDRHRTRRRLKRLRYATEFLRPWLPAAPTRRALQAMRAALEALGGYNDACVAHERVRQLDPADPVVAQALAWLEGHSAECAQAAGAGLTRLLAHRRYWA